MYYLERIEVVYPCPVSSVKIDRVPYNLIVRDTFKGHVKSENMIHLQFPLFTTTLGSLAMFRASVSHYTELPLRTKLPDITVVMLFFLNLTWLNHQPE